MGRLGDAVPAGRHLRRDPGPDALHARPGGSLALWDANLAHRDIKPANLLVRDGKLYLIDMFFAEIHPSPWRQAVDLANMMLCLALRSSTPRVYERALRQFTVGGITEAFAAARGSRCRASSAR